MQTIPPKLFETLKKLSKKSSNYDIGLTNIELVNHKDISAYQAGYSTDAITKLKIKEWSSNWIVIGSANSDPLIFDTQEENIKFDWHGKGSWQPKVIFENYDQMLDCFEALCSVYTKNKPDFFDNDFNVKQKYNLLFKDIISRMLPAEHAKNLIAALEIR